MPFNVSNFLAAIQTSGGLQRSNKFEVSFTPPPGLVTTSIMQGEMKRNIKYFAQSARIPGISMLPAEVRRFGYGPNERKPVYPVYPDANINFIMDGFGDVWQYLQTWVRFVLNYENPTGLTGIGDNTNGILPYELNYKENYVTDLTITAYNDVGDPSIITVLRQAYPILINDVQMSWDDKNAISVLPVVFTYLDWFQNKNPPIQPEDPVNSTTETGPSQNQ